MPYFIRKFFYKIIKKTGCINYYWRNLPKGVYAFNFHRIGDNQSTPFDRAIFSCTTQAFEKHVIAIKKNFTVITTLQLSELIKQGTYNHQRYALITFDDGYLDNYTAAFPILVKHEVPGVFFLVTEFVNSNKVPWWDEIAYLLRNSTGQLYQVPMTGFKHLLDELHIDKIIQQIMFELKTHKQMNIFELLEDVRLTFPKAYSLLQNRKDQLFMDWPQVRNMYANGMEIGSHTVTHHILSQLKDEQQKDEIILSKNIIEKEINGNINSIAYPVGRYYCYNNMSLKYADLAGYNIGFNNEPGRHSVIENNFDLNRYCVSNNDINFLKIDCCSL